MASKHRMFVRKRTLLLFVLFAMLFTALAGRLAWVQVLHNDDYRRWAQKIRFRDIASPASRGAIYDRNGQVLAISIEASGVYANRREVTDEAETARELAVALGCQTSSIQEKFKGSTTIVWLARQVDPRQADRVAQLKPRPAGIGIQRDPKRVYPAGSLASHVLGFTSVKNKGAQGLVTEGVEGLEAVLDGDLTGRMGVLRAELDARRRIIPETRHLQRRPEDGKDVYLTIDLAIQHIAEVALARTAEKFKPEKACVVVMDPHTGEILALANYPTFDPNSPRSFRSKLWRNIAVADLYEPGSTLKVVTVAAALNEGTAPSEIVVDCCGREKIRGGRITCPVHHPFYNGHGEVDMYRIIRHSCNIGAANLAFRLGAERLYKYEKAFGLLDRTDAGFGCEAVGSTMPPGQWRRMRLANVGFGQGIAVTPLQMAAVYATIANGGVYVQPQIVREIRNSDGSIDTPFDTKVMRRVISARSASNLTKMLISCVCEGTGKNAGIQGRTVAGKTGSAQIAGPNGYIPGEYVASFMGFAPANSPRLVIVVVVTRPQGSYYGATVAAPVFREIAEKALWYLKVPADPPAREQPSQDPEVDPKQLV